MKYFQVVLEGRNFLIEIDGKEELLGYFATRWVKADSPEEAELKTVDLIKRDAHLIRMTKNRDGSDFSPVIYLSEICHVSWFKYFRRKPGKGYSFFPMDNSEN